MAPPGSALAQPRSPARTVIVVGGGIIGMTAAWLLQRRGHRVLLVHPEPQEPAETSSASRAALGMLMGQVFHRSSGRGWRLRQRSLELWRHWLGDLAQRGRPIAYRPGLLFVAHDPDTLERQQQLVCERQRAGLPLEMRSIADLEDLLPTLPGPALGGLFSPADGQLDPGQALEALHSDATACGLTSVEDTVIGLHPCGKASGWQVELATGQRLEAETLVLAAGLGSNALLGTQGTEARLEPVLGQALELELPEATAHQGYSWPGAVIWQDINLVPRPDLPGGRRLWLGASLEPGSRADPAALERMTQLNGAAPGWLRQARVRRHWQGLRPRPIGQPAPLLERLAPGLLLASGHYRNGILLAPATAEWIAAQVEEDPVQME